MVWCGTSRSPTGWCSSVVLLHQLVAARGGLSVPVASAIGVFAACLRTGAHAVAAGGRADRAARARDLGDGGLHQLRRLADRWRRQPAAQPLPAADRAGGARAADAAARGPADRHYRGLRRRRRARLGRAGRERRLCRPGAGRDRAAADRRLADLAARHRGARGTAPRRGARRGRRADRARQPQRAGRRGARARSAMPSTAACRPRC